MENYISEEQNDKLKRVIEEAGTDALNLQTETKKLTKFSFPNRKSVNMFAEKVGSVNLNFSIENKSKTNQILFFTGDRPIYTRDFIEKEFGAKYQVSKHLGFSPIGLIQDVEVLADFLLNTDIDLDNLSGISPADLTALKNEITTNKPKALATFNQIKGVLPSAIEAVTQATGIDISFSDKGRDFDVFNRLISTAPTRARAMHLSSTDLDGRPETSNVSGKVRTVLMTPFTPPVVSELSLRKYQNSAQNSPNLVSVDFTAEGFPVVLSNETLFMFEVKAGTRLDIELEIGVVSSLPQELYRAVRKVDSVVPMAFPTTKSC